MAITVRPVQPLFEQLDSGVRFNIETVKPVEAKDINELVLGDDTKDAKEVMEKFFRHCAGEFYEDVKSILDVRPEVTLEVSSARSAKYHNNMLPANKSGLLNTCVRAFDKHHPLALSPDHIWSTIAFGFSHHIQKNSEVLRHNFVQHADKKSLNVRVDHFIRGQMSPEDWIRDVFPEFSRQIRQHIGDDVHDTMASSYSTTTPADKVTNEIMLMATMKDYFDYSCSTLCGIPSITLEGSLADWQQLRQRAEKLGTLCTPEFQKAWMSVLLPVLDQFVEAFQGNVHYPFWQGMVKRVQHGFGSGSYSTISGWISLLYPYLDEGKFNDQLKPWNEMLQSDGHRPSIFPRGISSCPVTWNYLGTKLKLHFHAGLLVSTIDKQTGLLRPMNSWFISYDP